jgi:hypothetical protein
MHARVTPSLISQWCSCFPLDRYGRPTSLAAVSLFRLLFEKRHVFHSVDDMASQLQLHPELVTIMCEQLACADLVSVAQNAAHHYRYNLHSNHVALQANAESFIVNPDPHESLLMESLPPLPPSE